MKITKNDVLQCALNAGIMLHSGYGQAPAQLMPVSDSETLMAFAKLIIAREAEKRGVK